MKSAIAFSAMLFLTILQSLPVAAVEPLTQNIAQPLSAKLHAQTADITNTPTWKGYFFQNPWEIKVSRNGSNYIYAGKNNNTNKGIRITGGRLVKSGGKHFYKWNNGGTIYQVTWQPNDPEIARVQIFNPGGKEIFNKLMEGIGD